MMIGVAGKDQVDAGFGQQRVVGFCQDRYDVVDAVLLRFFSDQFVAAPVNIDSIDFTGRASCLGQMKSEIASACAEIGDLSALADLQRLDDFVGLLPLIAIATLVSPLFKP